MINRPISGYRMSLGIGAIIQPRSPHGLRPARLPRLRDDISIELTQTQPRRPPRHRKGKPHSVKALDSQWNMEDTTYPGRAH